MMLDMKLGQSGTSLVPLDDKVHIEREGGTLIFDSESERPDHPASRYAVIHSASLVSEEALADPI